MRAFSGLMGSQAKGPGQKYADSKSKEAAPEPSALEKMLQNAGPIVPDGSDKFFGLENFGNTCYCNSILQALYFSIPFRDHVNAYPTLSPTSTPDDSNQGAAGPIIRTLPQNGAAMSPGQPNKGITAAEALRRRAATNNGQLVPGAAPKPEDKPDSPEYKKKQAMLQGPILEMTYETAAAYGMEESIFTALKDIFRTLTTTETSRTGVLSPQRLLELFKQENEMFRTTAHQDAHEFYGILLNSIITNVESNAKRTRELAPPPSEGNGYAKNVLASMSSVASSMGLTNGHGTSTPGAGWVHEIFEGILTSETKCLTCEKASQRDETFLDLSIDLEQNSSVTSCLRKFSAEEMLCERNKFHCDNCGGLQEAEKRMKIKKLPKILTLHLKRFKYTDDYSSMQKLFYRVVYPYQLRMFHTTDDTEDPDRLYELYAVVVHIGANAYHGHYVSIIKTEDRGWLLFDDEMVEPVDKAYVRNFFGAGERTNQPSSQACAYVLFYQETTLEKVQKEQEAEGLAEVAKASAEAGIALGNISPSGGTYPSMTSKRVNLGSPQTPTTPTEETSQFASLNHAMTTPMASPTTPTMGSRPLAHILSSPTIPNLNSSKMDSRAKEEREFQKKASKELEKAQKAAEKDRLKNEASKRKELEKKELEYRKAQADQLRATIAASKASAAEDEERRRREKGSASPPNTSNSNSTADSSAAPEKKESSLKRNLTLSRSNIGSRSMSRKSFLGFGRSSTDTNGFGDLPIREEASPRTPTDKVEKEKKSIFGISRKKSTMT